jgi:methylated-DNA-[protein]-cysteine S-methyltransferase
VSTAQLAYTHLDSPLGLLLLAGDGERLHVLHMQESHGPLKIHAQWRRSESAFGAARTQLREYFARERNCFDLALALDGSSFERRVWSALLEIPYGETTTYGEIARRIGDPGAARAVGIANARNPIAVIVPCHRVIGADGTLTGYGGGLERKRLLLELEREHRCPPIYGLLRSA